MSYICIGWTAGLYSVNGEGLKRGAVILQFIDSETGEDGYWAAFPAEVLRIRGINKGAPLGKNKFRIKSPRCKFYKFWTATDLSLPIRTNKKVDLSGFPDCMNKLVGLHFDADIKIAETRKLDNETLVHLPNKISDPANILQPSCNLPANLLQPSCNYPAISSCNESEQEQINSDYEAYSNTYANKRIKDKRELIIEKPIKHIPSTNNLKNLHSYYEEDKELSDDELKRLSLEEIDRKFANQKHQKHICISQ